MTGPTNGFPAAGVPDAAVLLADSRTHAPAGLAEDVLAAVGVVDGYVVRPTPIGPMAFGFGDARITWVRRADDAAAAASAQAERTGRRVVEVRAAPPPLEAAIGRTLATGRLHADVALDALSEFQRAVLTATATIPPGEVRPYSWIAREIGRPGATRAVGTALARNPAPLVIPCHRVVRRDGRIGRYALGSDAKRDLLTAEGIDVSRLEADADAGRRYLASDTTGIFCFPTCRHARRITEHHRRWFATPDEAQAAGLRACHVCRPAVAVA